MSEGGRFEHHFDPDFSGQRLSDGEKAMLLGVMLLGACLTNDPNAGVYEAEGGKLIASAPVDPGMKILAQKFFEREAMKAVGDEDTELYVMWREEDDGGVWVTWEVHDPLPLMEEVEHLRQQQIFERKREDGQV